MKKYDNSNTFYSQYKSIIDNKSEWFRFGNRQLLEEVDVDTLFTPLESSNFIKMMFFYENMMGLVPKVHFPDDREVHTVSAFIMGIVLKEQLRLSVRSLPQVLDDYHQRFVFFWSVICLSHDLTFGLEYDKSIVSTCPTIDEFIKHYHFKYNLLDESQYSELFRNYYDYRINEHNCVDHGLTCGLMIYNVLMDDYIKNIKRKEEAVLFVGEPWKYSKDYPKQIVKICETIARHNIWAPTNDNENTYIKYNLPTIDEFEHIEYSESESLLFLLGLVDTLEPIKCYRRLEEYDYNKVLKSLYIKCNNRKKSIKIFTDNVFDDKLLASWKGLENWLDVEVEVNEGRNIITISYEYEKEEKEPDSMVA